MQNDTPEKDSAIAPDVGALFTYRGNKYRVNGWICPIEPKELADDDPASRLIEELLAEIRGSEPQETKFRWCTRAEATHVTGSGVCGCRAPISEIEVTGMVAWHPAQIAESRASAERRASLGQVMC